VRNAVARFNQVKGVTDAERRAAWSGYGPPQSGMEWKLKSPTSTNTPDCMPATSDSC
jgi:hypothetical protein